jgi:KipI family sensor histidine kinase inhibitor
VNGCRIREAGDAAFLLELDEVIDPAVNAKAIAIARTLLRAAIPGVRDVRSTYRSVAVDVEPLTVDADAVRAALEDASMAPAGSEEGRSVQVPIAYGGIHGPDLEAVAAFGCVSPWEAAQRHAAVEYRVYMLGFLPGFAYMGTVDSAIAAPRKATPRLRVPAGSVGIAGSQTGIYPMASPGGWQIVGRTPLPVFDPGREQATLFAPGDRVRFMNDPAAASVFARPGAPPSASSGRHDTSRIQTPAPDASNGDRAVTVLTPGLFTTVQDEGRWGAQGSGVPVSGAMDAFAHRLANALVGNERAAATLEVTLAGPSLRIEAPARIAIAGAELGATLDRVPVRTDTAVACGAGSVLRFGDRRAGARAYVAFDGGIAVPPVLGSRSTHTRGGLGGLDGRALRAGDRLPLGPSPGGLVRRHVTQAPHPDAMLRVLPGPQDDFFSAASLEVLTTTRVRVAPQSDRMGYRLEAEAPIPRRADREMISDATFTGAIQVPPSGQPILLMADRQTTGGYPQIAVVITADLPRAAQLMPGDWIEFTICSRAQALQALADADERLRLVG